jgi:hypothetical protein
MLAYVAASIDYGETLPQFAAIAFTAQSRLRRPAPGRRARDAVQAPGRQCRVVGSRCDAPPPADTYAALSQSSSGKKSLLVFQILRKWQVNSRRQCHCRVSSWCETRGSNSLSGRRFPHQAQNSSRSVIEFRLSLTWLTARRVVEFRRDLVGDLFVQLAIGPEGSRSPDRQRTGPAREAVGEPIRRRRVCANSGGRLRVQGSVGNVTLANDMPSQPGTV